VFDIGLLARRLAAATSWLASQPAAAGLPVGYFGASTGAAAALAAAAEPAPISLLWYPAAAAPTWPARGCGWCGRPPC
jgi:dienelactone hydrolase